MKSTDFFWALVIGLVAFVLTLGLSAPARAAGPFAALSTQTDVEISTNPVLPALLSCNANVVPVEGILFPPQPIHLTFYPPVPCYPPQPCQPTWELFLPAGCFTVGHGGCIG